MLWRGKLKERESGSTSEALVNLEVYNFINGRFVKSSPNPGMVSGTITRISAPLPARSEGIGPGLCLLSRRKYQDFFNAENRADIICASSTIHQQRSSI